MPVVSMGTTIKKGAGAIGFLTSIDGLSVSNDPLETSALDTTGGYRTFVAGVLKDAGEVTLSGNFDYTSHNAYMTDFNNGTVGSYTIEFPDWIVAPPTGHGTRWSFSGVVSSYSTTVELEDLVSFEMTLKVSGIPSLVAPA